jgi:P27 family predicted phage terminase small subunit
MGFLNSGRRKQPAALKALRGNPSKTRILDREPKPHGEVVKPAELSHGAGMVWDRLAPVCLDMGTLTAADVTAFAKLCELEATAEAASAQKDRPGFSVFLHTTMVDSAGNEHQQVKIHPAIKLEGETSVKLRPYLDYFGMTPSSRSRIQVSQPDEPTSKWAGVLK